MRHIRIRVLAVAALAGLISFPAAPALRAADQATGALPSHAKYRGLSYGEWLAVWWQGVFAMPVEAGSHPLITGGSFGGNNGIVFVGGPVNPAGTPRVTVPVTVPPRTRLFVPIITVECSEAEKAPFHGKGEAELRACANGLLDLAVDPSAEVDGRPVEGVGGYRVESPLFRYGPLAARNVLGLRPGTQSDAVAAGYALLLPPFGAGVHRITLRADVPEVGIAVDTEVIVTVQKPDGR